MISVAIDGPSGAGKSTMAKMLADKLGYIYVDTGALYRAIGLYCTENDIDTKNTEAVIKALEKIAIDMKHVGGSQRVFLCGKDVSEDIRRQEISMAASNVSAIPQVRDFLFELQQSMARQYNVVMDGRDIGTVVLPNANVKIYLTATPLERAKRRQSDYAAKGKTVDIDALISEMGERDSNDMNRVTAPLKKADDAVEVDSTGQKAEETLAVFLQIIKEKIS